MHIQECEVAFYSRTLCHKHFALEELGICRIISRFLCALLFCSILCGIGVVLTNSLPIGQATLGYSDRRLCSNGCPSTSVVCNAQQLLQWLAYPSWMLPCHGDDAVRHFVLLFIGILLLDFHWFWPDCHCLFSISHLMTLFDFSSLCISRFQGMATSFKQYYVVTFSVWNINTLLQ